MSAYANKPLVIGVVGGGQLARMLALAGIPMGLRFIFLDPAPDACAGALGLHICKPFDDIAALNELAELADVITYEFENIPESAIQHLSNLTPVFPNAHSLSTSRDRLHEKNMFQLLGIPLADFATIDSLQDLQQAVTQIGLPAILKSRTLGYDGKGQYVIRNEQQLEDAWHTLQGQSLVLEKFVSYHREISIIAARKPNGETIFYPLTQNTHRNGILHYSTSLSNDPRQAQAEVIASKIMQHLNYVGIMTLELFDTAHGLVANEIAPRVHNSGHWTIEGAITSQFENHLRAILDLPLGKTDASGASAMLNFIGALPASKHVLAIPGVTFHDYGKKPLAGRKVGHATLHTNSAEQLNILIPALLAASNDSSHVKNS